MGIDHSDLELECTVYDTYSICLCVYALVSLIGHYEVQYCVSCQIASLPCSDAQSDTPRTRSSLKDPSIGCLYIQSSIYIVSVGLAHLLSASETGQDARTKAHTPPPLDQSTQLSFSPFRE